MAFVIKNIVSGQSVDDIAAYINATLAGSRFTAAVTTKKKSVEIRNVRLTYRKDYCGNHPLPCPVRAIHRKHPVNRLLEGADWVGFNDMLNNVLDGIGCVCDCASSHVVIRKAGARCVRYDAQALSNGIDNEWVKNSGAFKNYIGKRAPRSRYPAGTPGFATSVGQPNYPEHHHAH